MANLIVIIILILIVGAAICYIVREKKRGVRCVGCPEGGICSGNCSGCLGNGGCGSHTNAGNK